MKARSFGIVLLYSALLEIVITISIKQSCSDVKKKKYKDGESPFNNVDVKLIDLDDIYDLAENFYALFKAMKNYHNPPEFKVNLIIDTRNTTSMRTIALPIDDNDLSFIKQYVDKDKRLVFLIPGFLSNGATKWMNRISSAYLKQNEDIDIIFNVDWSSASITANYTLAVENTHLVAKELISFIDVLIEKLAAKPSNIHLIGHSLGAQVAGFVGKGVSGINRITGLDPANPHFPETSSRLSKGDADHVDVVHTNSVLGLYDQLGDIDMYVNGGKTQPGCVGMMTREHVKMLVDAYTCATDFKIPDEWLELLYMASDNACHHHRSVVYFIESIDNLNCNFIACSTIERADKIKSSDFDPNQDTLLGLDTFKYNSSGMLYITTNEKNPYCKS